MNIKELIKEAHNNAVERGFYDCPECSERLRIKQELGAGCHDEWGCDTCKGSCIDPNKNIGELLMLIVSELGEALEAHRCSRFADWGRYEKVFKIHNKAYIIGNKDSTEIAKYEGYTEAIKDTFEDEIADVFIRLFDFLAYVGIGSITYNTDWSELELEHNVGADLFKIVETISWIDIKKDMREPWTIVLSTLIDFSERYDIPIEKHIKAKMAYNRTRPHKHNKEY